MIWFAWTGLIPGEGNRFFAWGCLLFFFATFFEGVYHLADRRPKIHMDENGVYFPGQQREIFNWSDIEEFEFERSRYQDSIWLALKCGKTFRLNLFFLNISPEDFNFQINKYMKPAETVADGKKLPPQKNGKSPREFVEVDKAAGTKCLLPPAVQCN